MGLCKCGAEFESNNPRKIYCSKICANKFNPGNLINYKYKFKSRYGYSYDKYNEMFLAQEGKCKVCGRHQIELKVKLHFDHNHETGEARGLLCGPCNQALGLMKENKQTIKNMLEYVS